MKAYEYTVQNQTKHYMSLSTIKMSSANVWTATIWCTDPERMKLYPHPQTGELMREQAIHKDCRSKSEAERWAKDTVQRYQAFFDEMGFHYHAPFQVQEDGKTIRYCKSMPEARKWLNLKHRTLTYPKHRNLLWINEKSRQGKYGRVVTEAELALYDEHGERMDHPKWTIRQRKMS